MFEDQKRIRNSFNTMSMGYMHSFTTSWTSASSLFPVCHYWPNWL